MAQWVKLQLADGAWQGKQLFSKDAIAETRKQRIEMIPGSGMGYGLGWMLRKWRDTPLIEHGGNIDGFNAEVAYLPEKHVGFAILTNVSASSLTQQAIDLIFGELVPAEPKKTEPVATTKFVEIADSGLGDFEITALKVRLAFKREKGKVILVQSGAEVPLKLVADQTYVTDMKGVPDVKFTWQPSKKDPKVPDILLEQSGMKFTLTKEPPYKAPMSGEELLAKMIEAEGGRDVILRHRHSVSRFTGSMPSDGIVMVGRNYADPGSKNAQFLVFYGLGKRFGTLHSFTDGKVARDDVSFANSDWKTGAALQDAINSANPMTDLEPKKHYKSLNVLKEEKVRGEDAYVLERTPILGSKSQLFISKKSFLPLRTQVGHTTIENDDFRTVDGLTIPFKQTIQGPEGGPQVIQIESISFEEPTPRWAYRR